MVVGSVPDISIALIQLNMRECCDFVFNFRSECDFACEMGFFVRHPLGFCCLSSGGLDVWVLGCLSLWRSVFIG